MTSSDQDLRDDSPEDDGPSLEETREFPNKKKPAAQDAASDTPQQNEVLPEDDLDGDLSLPEPELEAVVPDSLDALGSEMEEPLDTLSPSDIAPAVESESGSVGDLESPELGNDLFLEEIGLDEPLVPKSDASAAQDDPLEFQPEEDLVAADREYHEDSAPDIVNLSGAGTETVSADDFDMSLEPLDLKGSADAPEMEPFASAVPTEEDELDRLESIDLQEQSDEPPALDELEETLDLSSAAEEGTTAASAAAPSEDQVANEDADSEFEFELEDETSPAPVDSKAAEDPLKLDAINSTSEPMLVAPAVNLKRNYVLTGLKLGLGVLVGLVLFQIGAWWIGFDWFGLAPKLPGALAWMAPANLREDASLPIRPDTFPRPPDSTAADQATPPAEDQPAGEFDEPTEGSVVTEAPPDGRGDVGAAALDSPPMEEPSSGSGSMSDAASDLADPLEEQGSTTPTPPPSADTDFGAIVEADKPAMMEERELEAPDETLGTGDRLPAVDPLDDAFGLEGLDADSDSAPVAPPPEPKVVGPLPPRWYSDQEVMAAWEEAKAADQALDGAQLSGDGLKQAARDFYVALAGLAERVTWTEPAAGDKAREAARQLAAQFEFDEKKLKLIGNAARQWFQRDLGKGIVLTGIAQPVESGPDVAQLGITLLGRSSQPIPVIARINDANVVGEGQRLLIMGTIVDNPQMNLRGYNGVDDRVVWVGAVYPLP